MASPKQITVSDADKKLVRSVLTTKKGVYLTEFTKIYKDLTQQPLDFKKYGFKSLPEFLQCEDMKDTARIDKVDKMYKVFAVKDDASFTPSFLERNQKEATNNQTNVKVKISARDKVDPKLLQEWEETLLPNSNGKFALCCSRNKMTREEVHEIFSVYGEITETSFVNRLCFVRYHHKESAMNALIDLHDDRLKCKPAHERMTPKTVIKAKDVNYNADSGETCLDKAFSNHPSKKPQKDNMNQSDRKGKTTYHKDEQRNIVDKEGPTSIYFGNLPHSTTKSDLERFFSDTDLHNLRVKRTTDKTFGFGDVDDPKIAKEICDKFNHSTFNGNTLSVQVSHSTSVKVVADKSADMKFMQSLAQAGTGVKQVYRSKDEQGQQQQSTVHNETKGASGKMQNGKNNKMKGNQMGKSESPSKNKKRPNQQTSNKTIHQAVEMTMPPLEEDTIPKRTIRNELDMQMPPLEDNNVLKRTIQRDIDMPDLEDDEQMPALVSSERQHDPLEENGVQLSSLMHSSKIGLAGTFVENDLEYSACDYMSTGYQNHCTYPHYSVPLADRESSEVSKTVDINVKNFPYGTTWYELHEVFKVYGGCKVLVHEAKNSKTMSTALIQYYDQKAAIRAMKELDGVMFKNRKLMLFLDDKSAYTAPRKVQEAMMNLKLSVSRDNDSTKRTVALGYQRTETSQQAAEKIMELSRAPPPRGRGRGGLLAVANHAGQGNFNGNKGPRGRGQFQQVRGGGRGSHFPPQHYQYYTNDHGVGTPEMAYEQYTHPQFDGSGDHRYLAKFQHNHGRDSTGPFQYQRPPKAQFEVSQGPPSPTGSSVSFSNLSMRDDIPEPPEIMESIILKRMVHECFPGCHPNSKKQLPDVVDLMITHVLDDGQHFWAIPVTSEEKAALVCQFIDELVRSINPKYLEDYQSSMRRCTAPYENEWNRAWVLELLPDGSAKVLFVDWGNLELIPQSYLKALPEEFWETQSQVMPFRVVGGQRLSQNHVNEKLSAKLLRNIALGSRDLVTTVDLSLDKSVPSSTRENTRNVSFHVNGLH